MKLCTFEIVVSVYCRETKTSFQIYKVYIHLTANIQIILSRHKKNCLAKIPFGKGPLLRAHINQRLNKFSIEKKLELTKEKEDEEAVEIKFKSHFGEPRLIIQVGFAC